MGRGMMAGKKPSNKPSKQDQMAQLQAMQAKMMAAQAEIEKTETESSAGGGAVTVRVNGKHQLVGITIKPELCNSDPEDVEMLQDLILSAANEALRQIDEMSETEMGKLTGGMGLPF